MSIIVGISILYFLIPTPLAPYTLETWTTEEGLPQNSVLCLVQDKTGYIWFGAQSGLVRFDGVAFRVYNRWNTPHLNNDKITALYEDSGGGLWVGTDGGGLSRMKDHEWTSYTAKEGLSNDSVRVLYGDRQGNLWIGAANGLNRLAPGKEKFEILTTGDDLWGNSITAITGSTKAGAGPWIGTDDNGLYYINNGKYQPYKPEGEPIRHGITALSEDRSGRLWIGTQKGLLCLEKGRIQRPAPANHPLNDSAVRSLMPDSSGVLWIGTDGEGIFQFNGKTFSSLPFDRGLADDFIYALLEDREANVWVGTFTGGLSRLTRARVSTITTADGLPQNLVRVLLEDRTGGLWAGMDRKGLVKIKNDKVTGDVFPIAGITALYQDNDNNLWIGTRQNGIARLAGGNLRNSPAETYTTREGLSDNQITAIRGDKAGNIWIGTANGLNRFEKGKFTVCTQEKDKTYPPVHIQAIEIQENAATFTLWVGAAQGLMQLKGGRLEEVLTSTNGRERPAYDIRGLYADPRGNLWLGLNGGGLGRFSNAVLSLYTTDSGLPNNYIFSILEDDQKNLWLSSSKGVFRVSTEQLDNLAQNKIKALTPLYLDEKDGMESSECATGGQPSAWKMSDGKLCFPTIKGVAVIDPGSITLNHVPPPVIIEEVLVNSEPVTNRVKPIFQAGQNMIEFYFTALSFTAPGRVKLRYKMEGFDSRWMEVAPREKRAAMYLNLGPGDYRFLVTACNSDGLWNEKSATFEFMIKYPFYKQPLFYILMAALLLITGAAAGTARRFYRKKTQPMPGAKPGEPKYKTSALLPETVEQVLPRLLQLMEKEKVFLKADLNLKSLAQRLNVHYNYLSQIINERLSQSFNDFINSYRIQEAKKKLLDPAEDNKTILDIAYDTGFYSKSVFNTAFKKFTGMTPSEFKRDKKKGG
ncbi:MAG: helix-turn-helix domain-containing protein [Candidatus Aminicenantes bacterium]|nr:helix-turn-helix domain-containing protein [Candidatus Aminicenantes bacterium]